MTAKNHMKIVFNVSCTYHKNKIRANVETYTFVSFPYITCIIYCILGLLQYKDEVNIKYQAAVRAPGTPLSFTVPADCPGPHFSPSQGCWFLPWCCCRMLVSSPVPDSVCFAPNTAPWMASGPGLSLASSGAVSKP